MDAFACVRRMQAKADGKSVWSWPPDAEVKLCQVGDVGPYGRDTPGKVTGATKPGTPGRARHKP